MPPVVLTITAHDTASPVLRSLQAEVHKLGASGTSATSGMTALGRSTDALAQQTTRGTGSIHGWKAAQDEAAAAVKKTGDGAAAAAPKVQAVGGSFLSGAGSALKFGAGMAGVAVAASAVGHALGAMVGHVVGFESAMANVATLGNNSVEVQQRLREELLKLPAVLGDSTTLAKGLYDVLSAGIPAADAVAFLGTSASLAKAGLADVNTTTAALTKTMAAFNIPMKDAGQLADVLFKVVDLGQGTLKDFAGAFPQVTQSSAALGFSFKDTAAAMATLTQTFKNADQAATGYRSMLTQLVLSGDKFRAAGINITKVIGEEGMAGVFRVLQELTGGNAEKLHALIGDTEGFNAALALTGPQFKLFLENQKKLDESTGVVAKGLKIQGATAQSTYDAMVADAGKAAIALAPPFLTAFTMIAKGARLYADDVNSAIASIKPIVADTADFFTRMFSSAAKGADNLGKANSALAQGMLDVMGLTVKVDDATRLATLGTQLAATETDEFKTATQVLSKSLTEGTKQVEKIDEAVKILKPDLVATTDATRDWLNALDLSGISAEAAAANYRKLEPALDAIAGAHAEAAREAAGFGTILQRNIDLADLTLESTLKLNEGLRKASFQQDFAKDELGLQKQLAVAYKELSAAQQLGTQEGQARAATLLKEIEALKAKLAELHTTQSSGLDVAIAKTDTLTASTARLTTQVVAAGSAARQLVVAAGAAGAGGIKLLGGNWPNGPHIKGGDFAQGGRMPGAGSGAQPMPLRPGSSPSNPRPPGFNIPGRPIQRFAEGGIVQGSGGVDSVPALLTPGERVSTPGQDRAISVSFGGDIVVNINGSNAASASPEALGDIAAQALVRALAPRLNESLRRGHGEKFA